jgi:hypothetical protein
MNINWKSESTYAAIGGGLVAVLTGTGLLVASEGAAATAVIANLAAGIVGLVVLIGGIRNRIKATKAE